jgi:hypothetical protein
MVTLEAWGYANCKAENIIYLLECAIGGLQYVGETKHNNLVND